MLRYELTDRMKRGCLRFALTTGALFLLACNGSADDRPCDPIFDVGCKPVEEEEVVTALSCPPDCEPGACGLDCPAPPGTVCDSIECPPPPPTTPTTTTPPPTTTPPTTTVGGRVKNGALSFTTEPSGATVTLRGATTGTEQSFTTPRSVALPPDRYTWEVRLDGFNVETSDALGVEVFSEQEAKTRVPLTATGNTAARLARADAAFLAGECDVAANLYKGIERPANVTGESREWWVVSRLKWAECSVKTKSYDDAYDAFKAAVADDPRNWSAIFGMGTAACEAGDYADGRIAFQELGGPLLGSIQQADQGTVRALGRYGTGFCYFKEYRSKRENLERFVDLRNRAKRELDEFLTSAERLLAASSGDPNVRAKLQQAIDIAEEMLNTLATG